MHLSVAYIQSIASLQASQWFAVDANWSTLLDSAVPLKEAAISTFEYSDSYFVALEDQWTRISFPLIGPMLEDELRKVARIQQQPFSALDLGCGNGAYFPLLKKYSDSVSGIDISEPSVNLCKKKFEYDQVLLADAESLPFENQTFDLVFSTEVLEHIQDANRAIREISRVLKPHGKVVFTTTMYSSSIWIFWQIAKIRRLSGTQKLRELAHYFSGFFNLETQKKFIMDWCYETLGGHYHGFHERQLIEMLKANGLNPEKVDYFFAVEPVQLFKGGDFQTLRESPPLRRIALYPLVMSIKMLNWIFRSMKFMANNIIIVAKKTS